MGVIATIRDVLLASTTSPHRGEGRVESEGAYWCDGCSVRVRDVDVGGDDPPTCPDCGGEMQFERSAATTGCAC